MQDKGQPPSNPKGFLQQEQLPFLIFAPHLVGKVPLVVQSFSHLGQDPRHKPYRLGLKLPDHHFEDRHNALADSTKCTYELVGQDWFQYGTLGISRVSPIRLPLAKMLLRFQISVSLRCRTLRDSWGLINGWKSNLVTPTHKHSQ